MALGFGLFGAILFAASAFLAGARLLEAWRRQMVIKALNDLFEGDSTTCITADSAGRVLSSNAAAAARVSADGKATLAYAFADVLASPAAMINRLQERATVLGGAREELVTRRGHMRVSVNHIGEDTYVWRVEDLSGRAGNGRSADALSLPMLTAGPTGTILYMNEAFRKLTGGRSRSLDKVFLDLPLVSGRTHEVEAINGTVSCLVAEVTGSGGRKEIYLLPADAAEPRLRGSGWDAIEDLPVPLLKVSRTGEVLASTREARALLPMPIGPDTRFSDLVEGLGRPVIDWLTDIAAGRGSNKPEFLQGAGGHQDTFLQVWLKLAGEGEDQHIIAVLSDVTELRSLEAQFVQSQKMHAIGQLTGGVAHDFNNLLTAISGHCDLLLMRHDQGDNDFADLTQISQNSSRAAALVRQLLAFSRKQNLMPELFDLRDTLSELAHLLNRLVGEKVTLTLTHDPDLDAVRADKRQLDQVIMNLVVNARDAMPEGGEIKVSTENVLLKAPLERDRATVPSGRYVLIKVNDDGTGIPPDIARKVFEPFYTTKRQGEGTGLGLSTAYGIVKQSGGYIFLDSTVGVGTCFSIYLPSDESGEAVPAPVVETKPALPAKRTDGVVLLVEDEAPVRAFAGRALRLGGYTVLEADSAESALELLSDPELSVDIFVTDVIMPGKDGPTWVREALADRPNTRVVFVSGYAEDAFSENQSLIPNSVFLAKPFSLTELATTVQQQLL
ncbi:MAG: response regulator [Rhodobacteraceae bacterium]|nr:response regulator [Paracoccaceae bacterium]